MDKINFLYKKKECVKSKRYSLIIVCYSDRGLESARHVEMAERY